MIREPQFVLTSLRKDPRHDEEPTNDQKLAPSDLLWLPVCSSAKSREQLALSFLQLQPICNKLERLHETFQSREEILSKLDASAADVEASLLHNKVVEAENRGLLSENEDLKSVVMIGPR